MGCGVFSAAMNLAPGRRRWTMVWMPVVLWALGTLTFAGGAVADPGVDVSFVNGLLRVRLEGSYSGSTYTVWRSAAEAGDYSAISQAGALCTGDCFVQDATVDPGSTYFYRFDLIPPEGGLVTYGPFAVHVPATPFGVRVWPNPGAGPMSIALSIPGGTRDGAVAADARIVDLQGRLVRVVHRGPLTRGTTVYQWDGRGAAGQVRAGLYFLHFSSAFGTSVTRIAWIR